MTSCGSVGFSSVGVHAGSVEGELVVWHPLIGVAQGPAHALGLQGAQALERPGLDGFEGVLVRSQVGADGIADWVSDP